MQNTAEPNLPIREITYYHQFKGLFKPKVNSPSHKCIKNMFVKKYVHPKVCSSQDLICHKIFGQTSFGMNKVSGGWMNVWTDRQSRI